MRFRTELADADIAKGFAPETDLFRRVDLALRITGLLQQLEHGSVCLLDGRWGTGKSTFVRQWSAELKLRNIPSIYFDSFASDYLESPFEAVAGAFVKAALDARRQNDPIFKTFLSRAAAVGKTIASVSAKVGVKAITLGAVSAADLDGLSEISDTVAGGLGDITEESIKNLLLSHATKEAQFIDLKRAISDLPSLLQPARASDGHPLVVFIDELDRCRPDFSLGILEVLKHFFRTDNVHFVLVTNRSHLELSVNHRYGAGEASAEYLQKFYDFVIFFDHSYERHDEGSVSSFVSKIANVALPGSSRDIYEVRNAIRDISLAFQLTLRQIEYFTTNVAMAYLAARDGEFKPTTLVAFLAIIKTMRPDLYRKAKHQTVKWEEIADFLHSVKWKNLDVDHVIKVFRYYIDEDLDLNSDEWRGYGNSLWNYNLERKRVISYLIDGVLDRFGHPSEAPRMIEE